MNQLTIIGNLTRSPESRVVGDSTVCNFDVAVNRDYCRKTKRLSEPRIIAEYE